MSSEVYFTECELNGEKYEQKLRACQQGALEKIKHHFQEKPREAGLAVLPTATGKSLVMFLAPYVTRTTGRCIILTPRPSITRAVLSSQGTLAKFELLEDETMPQVRI